MVVVVEVGVMMDRYLTTLFLVDEFGNGVSDIPYHCDQVVLPVIVTTFCNGDFSFDILEIIVILILWYIHGTDG